MHLRRAWNDEAARWIAWARKPGHDSYWHFHRRQLLGLLPPPGRLTLDIGCGEGRVARDLELVGHRVVGVDVAWPMVEAAAQHREATAVIQADASVLPIRTAAADLVVAFMSVHDMDDPAGFLVEAYRVLEGGGRIHVAIVHSVNSAGSFDGPERPAEFRFDGPYFESRHISDLVERDGLSMRFTSQHRPLEHYHRWLEQAGFLLETFRELGNTDPESKWHDLPLFAHLLAVKPPVLARPDRRLFHIASPSEAQRLEEAGQLESRSLATEGFVHCSTAAQVVDSTARHFEPGAELVLIELDPERVAFDVRWPEVHSGQRFPHLHGPLTSDSVVAVHPWSVDDRDRWSCKM